MIKMSREHFYTVLTIFLMFFTLASLVMWSIQTQISVRDSHEMLRESLKETKIEVRILQMHVQDQNAIMIREGIKKPGDSTTGPTHPNRLEDKDERD